MLLPELVESAETGGPAISRAMVELILCEMIELRRQSRVALTIPKNLTIAHAVALIDAHVTRRYPSNAPRLPQLAIYAIYQSLMASVSRYKDHKLEPLKSMKAADRKSGTVGDIVLSFDDQPVEAIETKLGIPVGVDMVVEAIEKIQAATVRRYFILSTADVDETQWPDITRLQNNFRQSNGCEIIVNGVIPTLKYYLRLLPSVDHFAANYVRLLDTDPEVIYEHKIGWNTVCAAA